MNRCSFIISQRAQDFSQDDMGPQCSLGPIVGRLYTRIDDKCEPVVKSIIDFAAVLNNLFQINLLLRIFSKIFIKLLYAYKMRAFCVLRNTSLL